MSVDEPVIVAASALPRAVERIRHVWIPTRDGTRLAARLWLPTEADSNPVPAILEYIPYRKNDWYAETDQMQQGYLAGHGYACVRVDMRGTGDSDGILEDEYTEQEQQDGEDVIAWLADQPWCTGAVGMTGISWGGFNSLQLAARRPEALKAIITIASTDDRYADDVHYMGGCVLGSDMLTWASTMFAFNARPPDPDVVGANWREQWLDRLERTPPYIEEWLSHQTRDDYWRHGSVCEDYSDITCAVYAVGGWADAYRNAVPRLLAGLRSPAKGLIGPWAHMYPELARPGPAIGFLQESLRWWDHWLKGEDDGIMDEPQLRVWMQDWVAPSDRHEQRPGRWVAEPVWPSPAGTEPWRRHLVGSRLQREPEGAPARDIVGTQLTGVDAGTWCPDGTGTGWSAPDQRAEDGRSLTYDADPLSEPLEILGRPRATLHLRADRPRALVAVRLCDVAPDGSSLLVTRGLLNLTHRDGHEEPRAVPPGEELEVEVDLVAIAHRFEAGHRIRVSVSPTYWPWAWPSPEPVQLSVEDRSTIALPVRDPRPEDDALAPFEEPAVVAPPQVEIARNGPWRRRSMHDQARDVHEMRWGNAPEGSERVFVEDGTRYAERHEDVFRIAGEDPRSAQVQSRWTIEIGREGWNTRVETESTMSGDSERFHITNVLEAYEGERRIFVKTWDSSIPRDGV